MQSHHSCIKISNRKESDCCTHLITGILFVLLLCRANILLDKGMAAKLADFGFAVELPRVTHGKTMFTVPFVARSEGYYPSEVTTGLFSDKSDVFSYGMVCFKFVVFHNKVWSTVLSMHCC